MPGAAFLKWFCLLLATVLVLSNFIFDQNIKHMLSRPSVPRNENVPVSCRQVLEAGSNISLKFLDNKWLLTKSGNVCLDNYDTAALRKQFVRMRERSSGTIPYVVFVGDSMLRLRSDAFINLLEPNSSKIYKRWHSFKKVFMDGDGEQLLVFEYYRNIFLNGSLTVSAWCWAYPVF
jgi:hypothetical protein